jgi:hypothetical protein
MSFSTYMENIVLNAAFGKVSPGLSSILYIALSSGSPGEDASTIHEPVGNGYARVPITNNKANWSTSTTGVLYNMTTVTFPVSTAPWGYIDYIAIFNSGVGGNMLAYGSGTNPQNIYAGNMPVFNSGSIVITLD